MASTNSRLRYRMAAIVVLSGLSLLTTTRFPRPLAAQPPARPANGQPTATLTIKITGARNAKGQVGVALFQDAKGFPEDASNAIRRQNASMIASIHKPDISTLVQQTQSQVLRSKGMPKLD